MKYKDVSWHKWDDRPSEEVFKDWVLMRKTNRAATSQTAINGAGKWINKLWQMGYTADDSLTQACELGWKGMEWVYNNEAKSGFQNGSNRVHITENVHRIEPQSRGVKDISMHEKLTDRSWAD